MNLPRLKILIISVLGLAIILGIFIFTKVTFPDSYNVVYAPLYPAQEFPLPALIITEQTPETIIEKLRDYQQTKAVGLVFSVTENLMDIPLVLNKNPRKITWHFRDSYLRVIFNYPKLPLWEDTIGWQELNKTIIQIAKKSKKMGFKGICLDVSDNTGSLWNPEFNMRYDNVSDEFGSKVIYQRGREVIKAINKGYPNCKIIIYPAGVADLPKPGMTYPNYFHWINFFNGLLSTNYPHILTVAAKLDDTEPSINEQISSINANLFAKLDEPRIWQRNGNLSLEVNDLTKQFYIAQRFSQKYIIIKDQPEQKTILRQAHSRLLKAYVYMLQKKQKDLSLGDFILFEISSIIKL